MRSDSKELIGKALWTQRGGCPFTRYREVVGLVLELGGNCYLVSRVEYFNDVYVDESPATWNVLPRIRPDPIEKEIFDEAILKANEIIGDLRRKRLEWLDPEEE